MTRRAILPCLVLSGLAALAGCTAEPKPPEGALTPRQAYKLWHENNDTVSIVDVRTPAEYIFNGHAPMARNVPVKDLTLKYNVEKRKPVFKPNPDFLPEMQKHYKTDETLVVMCAAGPRGQDAAKILKQAGYAKVYWVDGGFEGQRGEDCTAGDGTYVKPGWKRSGLIWTYNLNPEAMYLKD